MCKNDCNVHVILADWYAGYAGVLPARISRGMEAHVTHSG